MLGYGYALPRHMAAHVIPNPLIYYSASPPSVTKRKMGNTESKAAIIGISTSHCTSVQCDVNLYTPNANGIAVVVATAVVATAAAAAAATAAAATTPPCHKLDQAMFINWQCRTWRVSCSSSSSGAQSSSSLSTRYER